MGDDNGVNVTFVNQVDPKDGGVIGKVNAQAGTTGLVFDEKTRSMKQATQVTVKAGLGGNELRQVIVHEGVHVEDRATFVRYIRVSGAPEYGITYNPILNITGRQSERNAYAVENIFRALHGLPQRDIEDTLSQPPYSTEPNIDQPLFGDLE